MMQWVVRKKHDGLLLREYLRDIQSFSRRTLNAIKYNGGSISINGLKQKVTYRINEGDLIKVNFPPEEKGIYMTAENIPLDFVYEDEYMIVLNKAPGMIVTPSPHHPLGTVANGLLYYYEQNNIDSTIHIVTRLDRGTSGLLLVAKNGHIHSLFSHAHMNQKIKRNYQAIVEGVLEKEQGTIQARIGRNKASMIERKVTNKGKKAITHFEVLHRSSKYTWLNISLETGRTHQIRVHFSYQGYPLAGDTLYGGTVQKLNRHALHSSKLMIEHPISKKKMTFYSDVPQDMLMVFTELK